jgi:hypothetical protein
MKLEQKVLVRKNKNKKKGGAATRQSAETINASRIKGNIGAYLADRMDYAYTTILPVDGFTPWEWTGTLGLQPLGQKPKLAFIKNDGNIDAVQNLYNHYISGDMQRQKNEWKQDWENTHDPKWIESDVNRWKVSTYDDFQELTDPYKRYLNTKVEQFMTFMEYLQTISGGYRAGFLKWLKQMTTSGNYPSWVASIDISGNDTYTDPVGPALNKKRLSEVFKYLHALKDWDDPEKPTAFFPGILWFGGANIHVTQDLDIQTMVSPMLVDDILVLQHHYETEVFNATVPKYLEYFKKINDSFLTKMNTQTNFIDNINTNVTAAQLDNLTDEDEKKLKAEFDRQMAIPGFKLNLLIHKDTSAEHTGSRGAAQVKVADIGGTGVDKYNNWKRQFIQSYEYKEFIGEVDKNDLDALETYKESFASADRGKVDIAKLASEKTFYQGDVFANEDEESLNYDLVTQLRDQEKDYNEKLDALKVTYKNEEDAQKKLVDDGLKTLQGKLAQAKEQTLKDIQAAVQKNKENDEIRKKVEGERQKVASQIQENQDALLQLKDYSGCDTQPPLKVPPKAVLQDAKIKDLIKASKDNLTNIISGTGKKPKSIKQWYYELNQRYIGGIDESMDNGAKGYDVNAAANEEIGDVGYSGHVGELGDTKVEDGVAAAGVAIELVSMALPPPADLVGMVLGSIISLIGNLCSKAKQEEIEKAKVERARQIASFASWKQSAEDQVVSFLEGETDNAKFKSALKTAIDQFVARDPSSTPTDGQIARYKKEIIDARKANMDVRQNISDTIADNTKECLREQLDMLKEHNDTMKEINEDAEEARNDFIDGYTADLKTILDEFAGDQEKLNADLLAAVEKNKADMDKLGVVAVAKKQNTVTQADVVKDIKAQNAANEEAVAQGATTVPPATVESVVPGTVAAAGKPYKRKNIPKNSIANQIYMLNMNYIKSF